MTASQQANREGAGGYLGALTPQANTTVEPEFWVLLPSDWTLLNARMTSDAQTITARLSDYFDRLDAHCRQFANAPLSAIAFACTGASYLVGEAKERDMMRQCSQRLGVPLITAAEATVRALRSFKAKRIALVSPYPPDLTAASEAYWQTRGLDIVGVQALAPVAGAFHPIYALGDDAVAAAVDACHTLRADAVLLLGTGMPTLQTLAASKPDGRVPVLSVNAALVWATTAALNSDHDFLTWFTKRDWLLRARTLFPSINFDVQQR